MGTNREYVLLAKVFNGDRHKISNWFLSTKLDGQRALWDGGLSRGLAKRLVPWANNNRDERYKEPPICSGLWSRYGNIIQAPDYFLNQLPKEVFLDGELYMERGRFQETRSIVSHIEPGYGWNEVKYHIFDTPSVNCFFQNGQVNNPNNKIFIAEDDCVRFFRENSNVPSNSHLVHPFSENVKQMTNLSGGENWLIAEQIQLPANETDALEILYSRLATEIDLGGEGVMLRNPASIWTPHRSDNLLKVKGMEDDEAIVLGFVNGFGKLRGAMGALVIAYKNKEFQLSGFTDEERQYDCDASRLYAHQNPGELMIGPYNTIHFKRGDRVTFRYRGTTSDGIPREARYWRKAPKENL